MAATRYTIGKVFKFSYQGDIYGRDFKVVGRDGDLIKYVALPLTEEQELDIRTDPINTPEQADEIVARHQEDAASGRVQVFKRMSRAQWERYF